MARNWMRILFASLAVTLLVGCSSVEEQVDDGIENARIVFQGDAEKPNEKINNFKLFLPSGFSFEEESDESNIILSKGKESFILFLNSNELQGSRLYYDLMMADTNLNIIEENTFEQNGRFGFVAVIENSGDQYELITSIGGIKLTTISKERNIADNLNKMMMIVRSITTN